MSKPRAASRPATTSGDASAGVVIYRRLLRYAFRHWPVLAGADVAMIFMALTEAGFAALMKPLLDDAFAAEGHLPAHWIPLALVGLFLVRGFAEFTSMYAMRYVGRRVVKAIRGELFGRLLDLPVSRFVQTHSGEWISRVTYNAEQLATAATDGFSSLVRDVLTIVVLLAWMVWLSPMLTMAIVVVGPLLMGLAVLVTSHFRRNARRLQRNMGDVTHVTQEVLENHQVVRLYGAEAFEAQRFENVNERNRRLHMRIELVKATYVPTMQFFVACVLAVVIWIATTDRFGQPVTAGTFVSFLTAMLLLLTPIRRLTTLNATLQRGIAAGQSIFAVLDEPGEEQTAGKPLGRVRGAISLEGLSFRYGAAPETVAEGDRDDGEDLVLRGIDLSIQPGERIALVGASGSGKTTLISLLPRFYRPVGGRILLDGVDIADVALRDLRRQFAYVGQNVTLFSGSLADNIAYGEAEPDPQRVESVARAAALWNFIETLPQGLETPVGENGSRLSGGQRQRVAIARALYRDAPILILDEATSALDNESEARVQEALERVMQGRTTIVIAHRLNTIEKADRIVVMDRGRIVEAGRHDELIARGGRYAEMQPHAGAMDSADSATRARVAAPPAATDRERP